MDEVSKLTEFSEQSVNERHARTRKFVPGAVGEDARMSGRVQLGRRRDRGEGRVAVDRSPTYRNLVFVVGPRYH